MYQEKQRFTQWWLWAVLVFPALIGLFGIYWQIILGKPFGDNPMSDTGLIVFAVSMIALPLLFLWVRLETRIDDARIEFNYVPFMKMSVVWQNVESAQVLDYGTVGGWGIKHSSKYGTVYATGGDYGLAVKMKGGKKFVIGTQKKEELDAFLAKMKTA